MSGKSAPLWVALLVAIAVPPVSSAQNSDKERAAKAAFIQGGEAANNGDCATALEYYNRSYKLSQRPRTLFNIAVCEQDLNNTEDAITHLEGFLKIASTRDQEFTVEARKRLNALRKLAAKEARSRAGVVRIITTPRDATIRRKGDKDTVTGEYDKELPSGRHKFTISSEQHEARTLQFRLSAGTIREHYVDLHPISEEASSELLVRTKSSGMAVSVDGRVLGTTRLSNDSVLPELAHVLSGAGTHVVMVEGDGVSVHRQLHWSPGERVTLEVDAASRSLVHSKGFIWGLAGAGALGVLGGATIGVAALRDVASQDPDAREQGKSNALWADVIMLGGAAALAGAWYLRQESKTRVLIDRSHESSNAQLED